MLYIQLHTLYHHHITQLLLLILCALANFAHSLSPTASNSVPIISSKNSEDEFRSAPVDSNSNGKVVFHPHDTTDPNCKYGFQFLASLITKRRGQAGSASRLRLPVRIPNAISGALVQGRSLCADTMDGAQGSPVGVYECHGQGRNQEFTLLPPALVEIPNSDSIDPQPVVGKIQAGGKYCLQPLSLAQCSDVVLGACDDTATTTDKIESSSLKASASNWLVESAEGLLSPESCPDKCLTVSEDRLTLKLCRLKLKQQVWRMEMTQVINLRLQAKQVAAAAKLMVRKASGGKRKKGAVRD